MKLINPLIIFRLISIIILIEVFSFLFCIPIAVIYGEALYPFVWSAVITSVFYFVLDIISAEADTSQTTSRDGYLAVTLSWFTFTFFGSLPYLISGSIPEFIDAFFESTSGFTTTGASIISNVEILPYSILFYRSLTHWIGGIGIIVLVVIVLPSLRVSGYHLFSLESSLREKILPKTKSIGFRVLFIYLSLTLIQIILLWAGDMNLFDSICHTFGTIATGGFSTKNNSLQSYSSYSQYIVMIFMFLAGISQIVYYYLLKRNFRKIKHNEELWFYMAVILISGAIATVLLLNNSIRTFEESFREGFFQSVSIITCTGFATADYLFWPFAGVVLVFILMFAGGSTGSTSGGIKMARHLIVLKNIKSVFTRLNHPRAFAAVLLNEKSVDEKTNITIISFVILYLFLVIIGTVILLITGIDLTTSASAVATCMAGIGPGLGSVGPMSNYAGLPGISKVVLSILMITGRLEIITVFTLFTRSFWKL